MPYEPKNFDHLLGTKGFSDTLLKNHFTLYQGYVTNVNKLADTLKKMVEEGKQGTPEFNELKRRFGWEFNGMRLHEYYFGNMSKNPTPFNTVSSFGKKVAAEFSSYATWEKDFKASGAMRGVGWVVLCYDKEAGRLFNVWINEHDAGYLAAGIPLLVLDVFEHAYITDYGIKRADYIEAWFKSLDWNAVEQRFEKAMK